MSVFATVQPGWASVISLRNAVDVQQTQHHAAESVSVGWFGQAMEPMDLDDDLAEAAQQPGAGGDQRVELGTFYVQLQQHVRAAHVAALPDMVFEREERRVGIVDGPQSLLVEAEVRVADWRTLDRVVEHADGYPGFGQGVIERDLHTDPEAVCGMDVVEIVGHHVAAIQSATEPSLVQSLPIAWAEQAQGPNQLGPARVIVCQVLVLRRATSGAG
jgi:hypothetical protein